MKKPELKTIKSCLLSVVLGTAFGLPLSAAPGDKPEAAPPKVPPPPGAVEKKPEAAAKPRRQQDQKAKKRHPRPPRRADVPKTPRPPRPPGPPPARRDQANSAKQTWLGVAMAPVPAALREHLELAEGFGIHVRSVIPGSPAEKAGLRSNDILTRLDDQILTIPEHLAILIRSKKKGDKVKLGLIRRGKDQSIEVVLGEHDARPGPVAGSYPQPHMQHREWAEAMRRHREQCQKIQQLRSGQQAGTAKPFICPMGNANCPKKNAPGKCPKCKLLQQDGKKNALCPDCKAKQQSGPKNGDCKSCKPPGNRPPNQGKPPSISVRPGFPVRIFGKTGIVKINNQEGELTLTQDNDKYAMTIKDKDGKQVFSGPYNAEKGVKSLPPTAQDQLKKMKLEDLDVLLPKHGPKKPEGSSSRKKPGGIL